MVGFGERLKQLRGAESQASFAKRLGLSQVVYGRYELNQREPNLETLYQIGLACQVSADWLLGLPERGGGVTATGAASVAVGVGNAGPVTVNGTVNGPGRDCSACPLMAAHLETVRQLAAFQASTPKRKGK